MKLSIITITYNSEKTLADTMSSVAMQTWKDIEHIIVDGLSTDRTLDIANEFPHVALIHSEKDNGIYDAMNKGIALSSGDVVGILNSDDIYTHPNVLEKVAELFENPAVQAVYADLHYVASDNTSKVIRHWQSGQYRIRRFFFGWMPPHPTFFVRRELYERFGIFNTTFRSSADYELMLRFLLKHKVPATYLPEVIVKMRTGGASNASVKNRWKANREDKMAWKVNGLKPYFFTIFLKPVSKLRQYLQFQG
ncbi:glycosyltransferase family 2 protein [Flavihumibacter petaseus]|uniref:Putative glycosyltransferase n=1 Tax=Flavihumibacter petaseus NBRC 106054 TaxID=1220578 RepID=A0A0E9N778_9BACT|nr:glycosyltransferase family 2 protein [Flavihumibacter petaseus]GAO45205.1 putative glycosyltransferase [Flavihumibacter petaseus NBRC 106054]